MATWTDSKTDSSELVVLSLLADGAKYGYMISKEVAAKSEGQMRLTPGVLYPLLKGLEAEGLIASSWEEVKAEGSDPEDGGRRRKWYKLTAKGRKRLSQRIAAHKAYRALIDAFIADGRSGEPAR